MSDLVRAAFHDQAQSCRALGSDLTAAICETIADKLRPDHGAVAARVLTWPGDPSSRRDSVPLRLCGALHALVLSGKAPDVAAAYGDRRADARAILDAIRGHEGFILHWLDSPPQTNEVARSAALIAAARFLSALHPLPLHALELGASAGLNLNFAQYHLLPESDTSGVVLRPEWQGDLPCNPLSVADARGVDLRPMDAVADPLRLLAYCWADQTDRLARLRAALTVAAAHPPHVDAGDAAAWLQDRLAQPNDGMTFVYHTIAWQYFPDPTQQACEAALQSAGARATPDRPLAHFGMEADGETPGAGLHLRLWDGAFREWQLGRADFHGRWIDWQPRAM